MMKTAFTSEEMAQRIRQRIELHQQAVPDTVGAMLDFELVSCRAEDGEYVLRCKTAQWMRNVMGALHGGMSATAMDHAMGLIANSIRPENGVGPTVQLQLTYHAPIFAGEYLQIRVQVLSVTKMLTHLTAQAYHADAQDKLCVSATGTYYFRETV